jgi:hypothetical protein
MITSVKAARMVLKEVKKKSVLKLNKMMDNIKK